MYHLVLYVFMSMMMCAGLVLIGEARRKRPDHPACRACQYNLSGLPGTATRCPECGHALQPRGVILPREPFTSAALLWAGIMLVLLSIPGCCVGDTILSALFGPP